LIPFLCCEDPRNEIEWDESFCAGFITVDIEGNTDPTKEEVGVLLGLFKQLGRLGFEPLPELLYMGLGGSAAIGQWLGQDFIDRHFVQRHHRLPCV
jgi:hypothetical protein